MPVMLCRLVLMTITPESQPRAVVHNVNAALSRTLLPVEVDTALARIAF